MKRFAQTCGAAGAAALLLAACNSADGSTSDETAEDASEDPVYAEMASWNACEVLDDLQPIGDEMGIVGWDGTNSEGGAPGNSEIGNTLDPDVIGCNAMLNLGDNEGMGAGGEIQVKILPAESAEAAAAAFDERAAAAESESAEGADVQAQEFGDPWDQGVLVSWLGDSEQPFTHVIAQDGQWVFHIDLYHTTDFGIRNGGEPSLAFTEDELHQWFVETYLPAVNQTVNDKIAEVQ